MSGGSLEYVHSDIRHSVLAKIRGDDPAVAGVDEDSVEWDVGATLEYLDDLAELLYAYEWWQSGDEFEVVYRDAEREFVEKWGEPR